jgi:hypothetical protein
MLTIINIRIPTEITIIIIIIVIIKIKINDKIIIKIAKEIMEEINKIFFQDKEMYIIIFYMALCLVILVVLNFFLCVNLFFHK